MAEPQMNSTDILKALKSYSNSNLIPHHTSSSSSSSSSSPAPHASLQPLEKALLQQLQVRSSNLKAISHEVEFWSNEGKSLTGERTGNESKAINFDNKTFLELDAIITGRRKRLEKLERASVALRSIVDIADDSHVILASLSETSPKESRANTDEVAVASSTNQETSDSDRTQTTVSSSSQAIRDLLNKRDDLNLRFLRLHREVTELRKKREALIGPIQTARTKSSNLLTTVKQLRQSQESSKTSQETLSQNRTKKVREALIEARGKREMVKGVLRGLILESGLDWSADPEYLELMEMLGDEDEDGEEEEEEEDGEEMEEDEREE